MNALFMAPPSGLGANPADVLLSNGNWALPYQGSDPQFRLNTFYLTATCSNFQQLSPQMTPSVRTVAAPVLPSAKHIEQLMSDVKANLNDVWVRDRLMVYLEVANRRLAQARRTHHAPDETVRLLNEFVSHSERHALQNFRDAAASNAQSIEAIAIRDAIIAGSEGDGAR
jgi:hypothetical protein